MLSDDELDELVEQITVDAYGDEGYWSFLQAFDDEVRFPSAATLAGTDVTVTGIDLDGNERRGIVAHIDCNGHRATISLLDIRPSPQELTINHLLAAYRRWLGIA